MTPKPRCRHNIAKAFKCTEGDPKAVFGAFLKAGANSRKAITGTLVEEMLGRGSSCGQECEPYLKASAALWLLSSCRTVPSSWTMTWFPAAVGAP